MSDIDEIRRRILQDEVETSQARARIYARVSHYTRLFEGEDYDIDLATASFSDLIDGRVLSTGPLQFIGTHHGNEFLWGWHSPNRSIPELAYSQAQEFCRTDETIGPLAALTSFKCDNHFAELLSQWIAIKMNWVGAFEVPNEQAMVYLILKLSPGSSYIESAQSQRWCLFCGKTPKEAKSFLPISRNCAICDRCVSLFQSLIMESSENDTSASASTLSACLLCGSKGKRLFSRVGAICHGCVSGPLFPAMEKPVAINRPTTTKKIERGIAQYHCPRCNENTLQSLWTMALPADPDWDEELIQLYKCDPCGFHGLGWYEKSSACGARENFYVEWNFATISVQRRGFPVSGAYWKSLVDWFAGCSDRENHQCNCHAHRWLKQQGRFQELSQHAQWFYIRTPLAPGEKNILNLLAEGLSNQEIADRLKQHWPSISTEGVKNILYQLSFDDRTKAAVLAMRKELVQSTTD